MIGSVTNSPYVLTYTASAGDLVLQARLTDRAGRQSLSAPVTVSVDWGRWFYGAQRLPDGEMLLRYSSPVIPWFTSDWFSMDILIGSEPLASRAEDDLGFLLNYGTLVDVDAPQVPVRFYIPWAD